MSRQGFFEAINDVLTGGECFSPMSCRDSDRNIDIPDFEYADAMGEGDIFYRPLLLGFVDDFP